MTPSMNRLYRDHKNLRNLYDMLEEQVARYHYDAEFKPDLWLILDIVAYLNDYPRLYHHPLEEQAIRFMVENQLGDKTIHEFIHHQHLALEKTTVALSQLFQAIANDQVVPIETIRETLESYLDQSRTHLQAEEDRLFPLFEKELGNSEWDVINQRLPERRDPLFSEDPDEVYDELRERMLDATPK